MLNKLFICGFTLWLFLIKPVYSIEKISFSTDEIVVNNWKLKDVNFSLFDLDNPKQQLTLSSKQLSLPKPFSEIKLFDIHCQKFFWQADKIVCQQGKAKLKSKIITTTPFSFSFSVTEKTSKFNIKNLHVAKGKLSILAKQNRDYWTVTLRSQDLRLQDIQPYLKNLEFKIEEINNGKIKADIEAKGKGSKLNQLMIKTLFEDVSLQANQGKVAMETLTFKLDMLATQKKEVWHWENTSHIQQGEVYVDPFYLEIKDQGIHIETHGVRDKKGDIVLDKFVFNQPGIMNINAEGLIKNKTNFVIDSAHISATIDDLESFSTSYISPFIEQTELEGIKLKGQVKSTVNISKAVVQDMIGEVFSLDVIDEKQRISVENARGKISWTSDLNSSLPSEIHWDKIKLLTIPIEANYLKFLVHNKNIKLLQQSSLSLLGGTFEIKKFNWQQKAGDEIKVYFEGGVDNLSLEQLTQALDWTPLTGTISGDIPGVNYNDKILAIDGELKVKVFNGIIRINQLASSGLFTDFSKLYMDMEMENLDLHAITKKIRMGEIEGRLSGYARDVYLENWLPVTFYAWIGTPEDDDSSHRISQKAVENIANIGGGGAADVISKGFLRFFDTFGYDRIGFGCYLYQGVCQLMGVEAAEQGYYIIKGGGLPRIDVIGFNPRVDWKVLVDRLSRLSDTDEVVVQ